MWENWNFPMFLLRDGSLSSAVIYRYRCERLECDEEYNGSLQGLRNISGCLPPFMTMPTPKLILSEWTISPVLVGTLTTLQGTSRSPCTKGSMIHPLSGTLGSFSCLTYEMSSCSRLLTSNLNRPLHISTCSLYMAHITPCFWQGGTGVHMWSCISY